MRAQPGQSVERHGRQSRHRAALLSPGGVCLALDDDDRTETLSVDDERIVALDRADVLARQSDERVGSDHGEVDRCLDSGEAGRGVCLVGAVLRRGRRAQVHRLRAGGRGHVDGARRHGAVRDVRRGELEHGLRASLRVDRDPERDALLRIPGELGGAEQPAVVLRRDRHVVGRPTRDVRGLRGGDVRALPEIRQEIADLGERRSCAVGR